MKTLPQVHENKSSENEVQNGGVSRRRWMQLMGASTALAAAGCRYEQESIVPHVRRPEGYIPGEPVKQSALWEIGGQGRSVLATIFDGRPIKLDGNAKFYNSSDNPNKVSGSDALTQAVILDLYDPDRSRGVKQKVKRSLVASNLETFAEKVKTVFSENASGEGVAILSQPTSSASVAAMKKKLLANHPKISWCDFSPVNDDNVLMGTKAAFGKTVRPFYKFENADAILCLDSDPFGSDLNATEYSKAYSKTRDVDHRETMSRLWAVGSQMTLSAGMADERLPLASSKVAAFLADLYAVLSGDQASGAKENDLLFLNCLAEDLKQNNGKAVVVVGDCQPAAVHALACKVNELLGAFGKTVEFASADDVGEGSLANAKSFVDSLGGAKAVFVLGGNPVYDFPTNWKFQDVLSKVPFSAHLSDREDETSRVTSWHVNQAHPLEYWSDARSLDGTLLIGQPSVNKLFGGLSVVEMLSVLTGHPVKDAGQAAVKEVVGADDKKWNRSVCDGFVQDSASKPVSVSVSGKVDYTAEGGWGGASDGDLGSVEVSFVQGSVYDGRFANNGWLQEVPDPISKICWGNAVLINPNTAKAWGINQNQIVSVTVGKSGIKLPAHIVPGVAQGTVAIAYGYGRTYAGRVGGSIDRANKADVVGASVAPIRDENNWHFVSAKIKPTLTYEEIATTQEHYYDVDTTQGRISAEIVNNRVPKVAREGTFDSNLASSYVKFKEDHPEHSDDAHSGDGHEKADDHKKDEKHTAKAGENKSDEKDGRGAEDSHGGHGLEHWPKVSGHHFDHPDLTPGPDYFPSPKWSMTIDLNKCFGCNGCVVACQAENNIAVVGKPEVLVGRELHWIRIDRYFLPRDPMNMNSDLSQADYNNPKVVMQPVTCTHCEKAPCEQVCPVAATTHSVDGLNDMVYNRCIGTRYCGNNCPFKVRRFNYHNYSNAVTFISYPDALASLDGARRQPVEDTKLQGLAMNPEVSVRSRGVMEKCTFCVQRIQNGKIKARREGRNFRRGEFIEGEITTACQDACSSDAIQFGDASIESSAVAKAGKNIRNYEMLEELNLKSRLRYLARVRNPHPKLTGALLKAAEKPAKASAH